MPVPSHFRLGAPRVWARRALPAQTTREQYCCSRPRYGSRHRTVSSCVVLDGVSLWRKNRLWIGGLLVLLTTLGAVLSFKGSPYAFLDRFHPRREQVDLAKILDPRGSSILPTLPKVTLMEFRFDQSQEVLRAIQASLVKDHGYSSREESLGAGEIQWEFAPGALPARGTATIPRDAVYFASGHLAAAMRRTLEEKHAGEILPNQDAPACIVFVTHEEGWIERKVGSIRRFLHISN